MKRDEVVDISKGIGIILVVLGHLVYFSGRAFRFLFAFHMPLFYLLMGMVFPYELSFKKYLHKSKKILLCYMLFLLLGVLVTFAVPGLRENFVFDKTAKILLFYKLLPDCFNVGQIWFLFNSLLVITLYFLLSKLVFLPKKVKKRTKEIILTLVIFAVGIAAILVFNKSENAFCIPAFGITAFEGPPLAIKPLPLKLDTALCALLFFYIGILINKRHFKDKIYGLKAGYKIVLIVLTAVIVFFVSKWNDYVNICDCFFGNPVLYLVGSLCGVMMILLAASVIRRIKAAKLLSYIGRDSLLFFAIHSFPNLIYVAVINRLFARDYGIMAMPLHFALIGVPIVLLMIAPVAAAKSFIVKRLNNRKASETNAKKEP